MRRSGRLLGWVLVCWGAVVCARGQAANEGMAAGAAAMRRGDFVAAAEQFQAAVKAAPQFAEAYLNLGLALEQKGDAAGAAASLEHARTLKPTLRGANLFLGIAEYQQNALPKAEAALRREVLLSPKDAKAWMWLGVTQMAEGDSAKAVVSLDRAAELAPKDVDVLYHRGRAHLLESRASYEQMYALEPDGFRVHEVQAQAEVQALHSPEAIAEYKLAIERAPRHAGLHEDIGDLYWATGATAEAKVAYAKELEIDPYSVTSAYKLGCLLETLGDAAGAIPLLRKALAADATLENGYYYLGRAQVELGQDDAGVANLKRASVAKGDATLNAVATYQLMRAYRRLHRASEAEAALVSYRALRAEADRQEAERVAGRMERHGQLPAVEALPVEP